MEHGQSSHRKKMSAEDQLTFNRWLTANAVVGSILAAGLVAMALAGSNSVGRLDATVADRTNVSDPIEPGNAAGRSPCCRATSSRLETIRSDIPGPGAKR